jgi:predicted CoA-binding protein
MASMPEPVAEFLRGKRFAVAGVSRTVRGSAANAVHGKLRDCGYEVLPVNPNASQIEGVACYPNLASIPGNLDGVVVVTHPSVSASIVEQAVEPRCSASMAAPLLPGKRVGGGSAGKWMCRILGWFGRVRK